MKRTTKTYRDQYVNCHNTSHLILTRGTRFEEIDGSQIRFSEPMIQLAVPEVIDPDFFYYLDDEIISYDVCDPETNGIRIMLTLSQAEELQKALAQLTGK